MTFTRSNFFRNSRAVFVACEMPSREPDYVSSTGSKYWFSDSGVIRWSDHWSHWMESCDWTHINMGQGRTLVGYSPWDGFSERQQVLAAAA